jgi:hypothetical protein
MITGWSFGKISLDITHRNLMNLIIDSMKDDKTKMKKVKSLNDIKADSRIESIHVDYDGKGKHMVECKEGFRFENERTIEIGTVKQICYSINNILSNNNNTTP